MWKESKSKWESGTSGKQQPEEWTCYISPYKITAGKTNIGIELRGENCVATASGPDPWPEKIFQV